MVEPRTQVPPDRRIRAEAPPARKHSYYATDAVKIRQRIGDLERWARIHLGRPPQPRTMETRRFHATVLHHFAHFAEGPVLAENFLSTWTALDVSERAGIVKTEFKNKRFYDAEELAELIGLTMPTRFALGITTIGAIDFPPAARQRFQQLKDNASKRRGRRSAARASKPQRKAGRRLKAVLKELPEDGRALSVKDVCNKLSNAAEFARVATTSLPRVLRRLIEADAGEHFLMVDSGDNARLGALIGRRQDRPLSKSEPLPPPPPPQQRLPDPTDAIEFERWFYSELARFTPETAAEMAKWFYDERGKAIREVCRVTELESDFAKIAKRRRDELLGNVRWPSKGSG